MRKLNCIFVVLALLLIIPAYIGCPAINSDSKEAMEFQVLELKKNSAGYYDAVISVERITYPIIDNRKANFTVQTMVDEVLHEMKSLSFIEDGKSNEELEKGDIFIVPLRKPDWTVHISYDSTDYVDYIKVNFQEMLPENLRFDPLKSEAMDVARSIELRTGDTITKPVPTFLPDEWLMTEDGMDPMLSNTSRCVYQKMRDGESKEKVTIQYSKLDEQKLQEIKDASKLSDEDFLNLNIWPGSGSQIRNYPKVTSVAGHRVVYNTFEGYADRQWLWRYAYVDEDILIQVEVDTNPLEWTRTMEGQD